MDNKSSFILYHDQREVFKKLSKEQAGELIQAIFDYEVTGEMPELSEILSLVIIPIKQSIDRNRKKYNDIADKRKEAGSKGGKQTQAKQANATFAQAKQASSSVSVNVNVNDNVNANDIKENTIKEKFEKFYAAYPVKKAKQYCENIFAKVVKNKKISNKIDLDAFTQVCITAISNQKQEKGIKAEHGKFVAEWKNPSTWLNQGCWNDVVDLTIPDQQATQSKPKTAGDRNVELMNRLREEKRKKLMADKQITQEEKNIWTQ